MDKVEVRLIVVIGGNFSTKPVGADSLIGLSSTTWTLYFPIRYLMIMAWILAITLAAIGIYFIVKRRDVARGESMVMGGTLPPGCAAAQGVLLIIMGVAFVVWYSSR